MQLDDLMTLTRLSVKVIMRLVPCWGYILRDIGKPYWV